MSLKSPRPSNRPIQWLEIVGDVNFAKKTSNFDEINPQSIDGNFAKEPLDFVNVNFTKAPLNLDEIDTHSIDGNFMKNIWIWIKSTVTLPMSLSHKTS